MLFFPSNPSVVSHHSSNNSKFSAWFMRPYIWPVATAPVWSPSLLTLVVYVLFLKCARPAPATGLWHMLFPCLERPFLRYVHGLFSWFFPFFQFSAHIAFSGRHFLTVLPDTAITLPYGHFLSSYFASLFFRTRITPTYSTCCLPLPLEP